jgi:Mrp family chromosome partitioning ATPase
MKEQADRRHVLEQAAESRRIFLAVDNALGKMQTAALLVTSATRGEGKTITAATLAASAALLGKGSVLAVDFNWFRPGLHACFGVGLGESIASYAAASVAEIARPTGIEHCDIVAVPSDHARREPRAVSGWYKIATRLIDEAKQSYQFIVIDASSVIPTNRQMMDPVILGAVADGVVLVVQSGVSPRQDVRKAQKILEGAGVNMLGVINNQFRPSTTN